MPSASITRAPVCLGLGIVLASLAVVQPTAQEAPPLAGLLARGGQYVLQFVAQFANVVAEERYVQTWRGFRRQLTSDFLLIQPQNSTDYFAFRDVLTADGVRVRDRDERLMKLLLDPSGSTIGRVNDISREGARYSFGGVFNSPVVVIAFLQPDYQTRFRFKLAGMEKSLGDGVWEIGYDEQTRPTILRGQNDTDVPASGRFWIEAETGRIVKTELSLPNDSVITRFKFDDRFQIDVPVEMTDRYRYMNNTVIGTATYGRFRHFGVSTEEAVQQ